MNNYWINKKTEESAHMLAQAIADRFRHLIKKELETDKFLDDEFTEAFEEVFKMEIGAFLHEWQIQESRRNIADLEHEMALLRAELEYEKKARWKFRTFLPTE